MCYRQSSFHVRFYYAVILSFYIFLRTSIYFFITTIITLYFHYALIKVSVTIFLILLRRQPSIVLLHPSRTITMHPTSLIKCLIERKSESFIILLPTLILFYSVISYYVVKQNRKYTFFYWKSLVFIISYRFHGENCFHHRRLMRSIFYSFPKSLPLFFINKICVYPTTRIILNLYRVIIRKL